MPSQQYQKIVEQLNQLKTHLTSGTAKGQTGTQLSPKVQEIIKTVTPGIKSFVQEIKADPNGEASSFRTKMQDALTEINQSIQKNPSIEASFKTAITSTLESLRAGQAQQGRPQQKGKY